MKRVLATGLGVILAAGLVMASPTATPDEVVTRHYAAEAAGDMVGNWKDWHPEATQEVTIKYGLGQPDDTFTISMADLDKPLDLKDLPEDAEDYVEKSREPRKIDIEDGPDGVTVVATQKINYAWRGYEGAMVQTDRFQMTTVLGQAKIRSLQTTLDYR